jgi:hypothetical protein
MFVCKMLKFLVIINLLFTKEYINGKECVLYITSGLKKEGKKNNPKPLLSKAENRASNSQL